VKVLVVKIAAIGDLLMATPALRALRSDPQVEAVHLLAGRSIAAVARDHPDVDRVFFIDDRRIFHGGLAARIGEVLRVSLRLRREKYAVGFNFHRDWRFNIILFLAGCRRRVGFMSGRRRSRLLTEAVAVTGIKHHIFHYCDLVKTLGIFCLDFKMAFPLSAAAAAEAVARLLAPENLGEYIVLAPGGAANIKEEMESRRWPVENFSVLAGMLIKSGQRVVLLGSGQDAVIAARITAEHPGVVDLSDRTTLAEAAAVLKRARLVVCNDSGLMHLAAAVGAQVVALFGPTHPGEKKPLNEGSIAVWKGEGMACSPCYHDGEFPKCDHMDCLKRISPLEIFELTKRF
jgi:heptosyltransferase-2